MFSITPLPGRTGVGIIPGLPPIGGLVIGFVIGGIGRTGVGIIPGLPGLPGLVGIGSLVIGFVIGIGGFGTGLPGFGLFMLGIMK
jgi:hypothetical protein